jgi:hypothetical protein
MARPLSTSIQKFEVRHPQPSDGQFVAGIWSVTVISLGTFLMWLLL